MSHKAIKVAKRRDKSQFNLATILRNKATDGEIGMEIEVEGNKFQKESIPKPWKYTKDGSLRGQDNAEYILSKPIKFSEVPASIGTLWKMFDDYGSVLDESNRTSVHVHLNCQSFHLNRLTSFLALYFSIEELLTAFAGEHRIGNLFCLRAKDAPAIVSSLKQFIKNDGQTELRDNFHYAGLNANALHKFGSLEIRSLRGCRDPQTILDWVAMLERLYVLSESFKDPRAICNDFSGSGPMAYLDMVLGSKVNTLRANITYNNQEIMESLYNGIRLAQDLCYCREWDNFTPVNLTPDPFGRSTHKVADSLMQAAPDTIQWQPVPHYTITTDDYEAFLDAMNAEIPIEIEEDGGDEDDTW